MVACMINAGMFLQAQERIKQEMLQYSDLNTYLRETFGKKGYKLSLDAGFTCPNRDGTIGTRGCSFCSAGGSGEFAASRRLSIREQIEEAKERIRGKLPKNGEVGYLAYFQAFTNTYAPAEVLRKVYEEAMEAEDVVALSIATRPDCLQPEVVALLEELNRRKPIFVELGLQTMHEGSEERIRRGYPLTVFEDAVQRLSQAGIKVVVHLILGLPYETKEDMLASVSYVCEQPIHGLKLQLLHLLEGTDMGEEYKAMLEEEREKVFACLSMDAYLDMVIECLKIIPPSVVVHRLTGDGPKRILIAPKWSGNKKAVLNALRKKMGDC